MNVITGINVTIPTIIHTDEYDLEEEGIRSILRTSPSLSPTVPPAENLNRGLLSSKSPSLPLLYDNITQRAALFPSTALDFMHHSSKYFRTQIHT